MYNRLAKLLLLALFFPVAMGTQYIIPFSPRPAGGCPGGAEFCDAFDTDTLGSTWISESGVWDITTGELGASAAGGEKFVRFDTAFANSTYQVACWEWASGGSGTYSGVFFAADQSSTGAAWQWLKIQSGNVTLLWEYEDRTAGNVDSCGSNPGTGATTAGMVICHEYDAGAGGDGDADLHWWADPNGCTIASNCFSSWDSAHTNWGTPDVTETADDADCTDSDGDWPDALYTGISVNGGASRFSYWEAWSSGS